MPALASANSRHDARAHTHTSAQVLPSCRGAPTGAQITRIAAAAPHHGLHPNLGLGRHLLPERLDVEHGSLGEATLLRRRARRPQHREMAGDSSGYTSMFWPCWMHAEESSFAVDQRSGALSRFVVKGFGVFTRTFIRSASASSRFVASSLACSRAAAAACCASASAASARSCPEPPVRAAMRWRV
jgi:hypothetical protein